jgi:hypothetical protein
MVGMESDETKPRRRWQWHLAVSLFLLFVVYPLSVGPLVWLVKRGYLSEQSVIFYAYVPLGWLEDQWPPIERAFDWYANLWGGV